jgi:hypothetical protein
LLTIASDLGEGTSTELLQKCAHYFEGRGDIEKAVQLLITAKKIDDVSTTMSVEKD